MRKSLRWLISGLVGLFLFFDAVSKIAGAKSAVDGTVALGYSAGTVPVIGWVLLVITILYFIPRTACLGAVFITGYLGGAIASMIIAHQSMIWFPLLTALFTWAGLYARDENIRAVVRG